MSTEHEDNVCVWVECACGGFEHDPEPHTYPCPTCGGNGCPSCAGTGERTEAV